MAIEKKDSVHYNQVSSKEMKAFFENGNIEHSEAISNVLVAYYHQEQDSSLVLFDRSETSLMRTYFEDRKLNMIVMSPKSTGMVYPMAKIPSKELYLPGFAWFDYIRPVDKDDLLEWRGKKSGQELRPENHSTPPIQSLKDIDKEVR